MDNRIRSFLLAGGTLEDLGTRWGIAAKRHHVYPNLVMFKYDQIESPAREPMVQAARGVILDEANDWQVVAWPFDRFFNYGDPLAAEIDWETAVVQEKLDGSLMILYHYDGKWRVASSGTPDAFGEVGDTGITFADLFWSVWDELGYRLPGSSFNNYTFMFELMTPYNRVVVRHERNRLVFLGARDRRNGMQLGDIPEGLGWETVSEFPRLCSFEKVIATFESIKPLDQEGYVVVDAFGNRVKVKHPGYVALHHMKDSLVHSRKAMLDVIRKGEKTEFLIHFPEYTSQFKELASFYHKLVEDLRCHYEAIRHIETQKEFAAEALKSRMPDCLFRLRKGMVQSVGQYLADVPIDRLTRMLEG